MAKDVPTPTRGKAVARRTSKSNPEPVMDVVPGKEKKVNKDKYEKYLAVGFPQFMKIFMHLWHNIPVKSN